MWFFCTELAKSDTLTQCEKHNLYVCMQVYFQVWTARFRCGPCWTDMGTPGSPHTPLWWPLTCNGGVSHFCIQSLQTGIFFSSLHAFRKGNYTTGWSNKEPLPHKKCFVRSPPVWCWTIIVLRKQLQSCRKGKQNTNFALLLYFCLLCFACLSKIPVNSTRQQTFSV